MKLPNFRTVSAWFPQSVQTSFRLSLFREAEMRKFWKFGSHEGLYP